MVVCNLYLDPDPAATAQEIQNILKLKPKWPLDSQLNSSKETILLGYLTSGNVSNRHATGLFLEPQSAYFNDGSLSVAIEEINNDPNILPNHNVSKAGLEFSFV